MSEFLFTLLVFAVFLILVLAVYNNIIIVKKYTVKTKKPCGGLKVVLISDFHNNIRFSKRIARKARECKPDIIVIAGDFVDRRETDFKAARQLLNTLSKLSPICYATGNHEDFLGCKRVITELDCADIIIDEKYKIYNEYSVLGLSDSMVNADEKQDLLTVFEQLDNFKIAVIHRPVYFTSNLKLSGYNIDLVLCGHNHGGVVRLPFFGALAAHDEGIFPKYSKGVYKSNGSTMIVSGGAGNTFLPLRINNFPEIVCITIEN